MSHPLHHISALPSSFPVLCVYLLFFLVIRPPPRSTLFPYTTLFRSRLTHPNIVPIFTVDEIGGFVFFAMAYVAGETLSQRVTTRGPLDAHEAGRLLLEVGDARRYAHARGVVHRDVKPDNSLLDAATGRALLSDFGIAYESPFWGSPLVRGPGLLRRPSAPRGHVVGTAAFMSPEQA